MYVCISQVFSQLFTILTRTLDALTVWPSDILQQQSARLKLVLIDVLIAFLSCDNMYDNTVKIYYIDR